ncbi:GTPase HflX [[Actinobacillus] muris]|uniref:GTPase HflX n=1 Tax=Muribacter muris TaxID=67855 RepID=A0A0J5P9V5_9PAST|nr:ribosome rescue GTPase HflX [Muribacter muris]KMK52520.1 GTPase HflX [[Actinobacillus] muris] [Muribacter muris]
MISQPSTDNVFGLAQSGKAPTSAQTERAILVHLYLSQVKDTENLLEFQTLAQSAGVEIAAVLTGSRQTPHIKYYVGQGKAQEIAQAVETFNAAVILVNHALSPAQNRNLSQLCGCRVVDRTGLILDIFAQRARSHEGKLQVELAQLRHLSSRLVRRLGHQDQQKGGAVGLRGPGETQLETDKRLIKLKILQLQNRLEKVHKQRSQNRKTRQKADIPTISLVGYTNAGKSTLFNRLTNANVYAADQLFATLDPTLRRLSLQDVGTAILADTVGFIRFLPHDLVSAFKSTLQETSEADLLLHVIDAADSRRDENIAAVNQVLENIQAHDVPSLLVFNKIDRLEGVAPHITYDDEGSPTAVYLAAETEQGIDLLLHAISAKLKNELTRQTLLLPVTSGRIYAKFYQQQCILSEQLTPFGDRLIDIEVDHIQWQKWLKQYPELNEFAELAKWEQA